MLMHWLTYKQHLRNIGNLTCWPAFFKISLLQAISNSAALFTYQLKVVEQHSRLTGPPASTIFPLSKPSERDFVSMAIEGVWPPPLFSKQSMMHLWSCEVEVGAFGTCHLITWFCSSVLLSGAYDCLSAHWFGFRNFPILVYFPRCHNAVFSHNGQLCNTRQQTKTASWWTQWRVNIGLEVAVITETQLHVNDNVAP